MAPGYRLYGNELSPYSVKVRSYLRYKRIPHQWLVRNTITQDDYQRHARLPLIPLVVGPGGTSWQDSTPIIEQFEARYPEPALLPPDPELAFLSVLLEEYADEWGNKPMFHYRWAYAPDRAAAADRLARSTNPGLDDDAYASVAAAIARRMTARLAFVGSSEATQPLIERSFRRQVRILGAHLQERPYLFGGRPTLADFGLFAQLYECSTDPTPGALLRRHGPAVLIWIERMLNPEADEPFESWATLAPTLLPLLREEVGAVFFPWTLANDAAVALGQPTFSVELDGETFTQDAQKYHARSLAVLRTKYAAVADKAVLDPILDLAGCLAPLRAQQPSA
jgi:glutathione S-transferase